MVLADDGLCWERASGRAKRAMRVIRVRLDAIASV